MPATARKLLTALLTGGAHGVQRVGGSLARPAPADDEPQADRRRPARRPRPRRRAPPRRRRRAAPALGRRRREAARAPPPDPASLPDGQVLAGAAKTSIAPRPQDYDGTWETEPREVRDAQREGVQALMADPVETADHLAAAGSPWPENPNCIYMGGFGIGPMNPVTSLGRGARPVGPRGRAPRPAGRRPRARRHRRRGLLLGLRQQVRRLRHQAAHRAARRRRGARPRGRGHRRSPPRTRTPSPDFIGGWGFVPDWYMKQVADTIKSTVRDGGRRR